ncbi:glycosyltransferase family 4 protein [Aequorivita xiaoshiensis]|uniref:Glycosyltransferase family 4 protein n=1 Tax=Aequorivita xiaoshiensis TaxID=2874476 RepID=A0A9X1R0C4_9FLAO|nr:glycosyltransferase family 4 protein [Aequorivita xiaoshiensis]MCG2429979.1 glycosyltransferase family 4 protein [Aequorivita xiaoshiensis]
MKVLHILYQSLPQVSGSSIRSRDTLMSQKNIGLDVVAITSDFQGSVDGGKEDIINGIRYIRTTSRKETVITDNKKGVLVQLKKLFSIVSFSYKLFNCVKREKPDVLHAHAMFYCGIPAILIGKLKKIPVVYEFRSLWMFQNKTTKKTKLDLLVENFLVSLETFTLKQVDAAVFLNDDLRTYFESKGNKFKNSYVVNNAVNLAHIEELTSKNAQSENRKELVFGYIGTLTAYEGIEFLVECFQELNDLGIKNKLLIYGDGISREAIIDVINSRPDIDTIKYLGKVSPNDIPQAFSGIDVVVNPRLNNDVTQSVTPLKPLEAMAYKKLFIGSDVGGILALISPNKNGFIFKSENKESLKNIIKRILQLSDDEKSQVLENALMFVQQEKSWQKNALMYEKLYNSLL